MKVIKLLAKWVLYLLIGLVALLGVGVVVLNIYKQEILSKINTKLLETVEGDVRIGDYEVSMLHAFPHLSITLKDIYLHGPKFEQFHKPFLKAARIHINIASHELIFKEINVTSVDVEDGEIFIFKTRAGYSNTEVFKSRQRKGDGGKKELAIIDLRQINLSNIKFTFHDSLKLKHLGMEFHRTENLLTYNDGATLIETRGNMSFQGLMLNSEKGSFLRNLNILADLHIELDSTLTRLAVRPSRMVFDKSTVAIEGDFHFTEDKQFNLTISSENVDHQEAQLIVHDTLASKISRFTVEQPIKIKIDVNGVMQAGVKPTVKAAFSLQDSNVTAGKLNAEHVSLLGTFVNNVNKDIPNDDTNARLYFEKFKGEVDHMPVTATLTLTNMKDPTLDLKAVFDTPLKNLNDNFDSTTVQFKGGHFHSSFTYSGKLSEYLDEGRTEYDGKLSGQATISNGAFNYNGRNYQFKNVNAVFDFTENIFSIKALNLSFNKNEIAITGKVNDFIPFFIQPKHNAQVKLSIVSPRIDLKGFAKPRIVLSKKRAKAKMQKSKEKMVDIVDRLNEHLDLNVTFNIAQFASGNFKASQMKGQMLLAKNQLQFKNMAMNFGGGNVSVTTVITKVDNEISPISIQATAKDVALKDFFYSFNDFNQKTFTHDNIEGKLTLDIDLHSSINSKLDLQLNDLQGTASFTVREMRLSDFEPIKNLSNFLMKKRDFADVSFGNISSEIDMQGTKMKVARMEVESTVISMFVEGIYDLGDSTDLAVQVPLSNLKKRDQEIPPENIGTDSRVGPSVFLRVRTGKDGKTVIAYDPFKKFRKEKKNKKSNDA